MCFGVTKKGRCSKLDSESVMRRKVEEWFYFFSLIDKNRVYVRFFMEITWWPRVCWVSYVFCLEKEGRQEQNCFLTVLRLWMVIGDEWPDWKVLLRSGTLLLTFRSDKEFQVWMNCTVFLSIRLCLTYRMRIFMPWSQRSVRLGTNSYIRWHFCGWCTTYWVTTGSLLFTLAVRTFY